MKLLENLTSEEIAEIKTEMGEAFVTNELFHEWGECLERHELVMQYMRIYVQCVYESKSLYATEDGNAYIGVAYSDSQPIMPKIKMLLKLLVKIPFHKIHKLMRFVKEILKSNEQYSKLVHTEILMVCVKKSAQGMGYTRELVEFAKEKAKSRLLPLLFDTDMKEYAEIYQHLGCKLYNQITASNGVTRYSLVWLPNSVESIKS